MDRIGALDIARGLCVALVVLLHATLLPQSLVSFQQPICRMALLMLVSGALAAPALHRAVRYSLVRSADMIWLVVIWTPICLAAMGDGQGLVQVARELIAPSTHLWYITALALLIPSVALLRHIPAIFPFAVSVAAAAWHTAGGRFGIAGYDQFAHFAVFFYLGVYGRDRLFAALARCGRRVGAVAAVALVALLALPLPSGAVAHSIATIGAAAMLLLAANGLSTTRLATPLAWFGRRTPDVYLAHLPVLLLIQAVTGPFGAGALALIVGATITACLGLRHLADRIGLGWLYRRPSLHMLRTALAPHPAADIAAPEAVAATRTVSQAFLRQTCLPPRSKSQVTTCTREWGSTAAAPPSGLSRS